MRIYADRGTSQSGMLHMPKKPSGQVHETLRHYNLLVSEDSKDDIEFGLDWSADAINAWLRRLLHKLFDWLDAHCGKPAAGFYHWILLGAAGHQLYVINRPTVTGKVLDEVKGTAGRKWNLFSIVIGMFLLWYVTSYSHLYSSTTSSHSTVGVHKLGQGYAKNVDQ